MSEYDWGSDVLFFGDDSEVCQWAKNLLKEAGILFIDKRDSFFDQHFPQVHYGKYMWTGLRGITLFIERWKNGTCDIMKFPSQQRDDVRTLDEMSTSWFPDWIKEVRGMAAIGSKKEWERIQEGYYRWRYEGLLRYPCNICGERDKEGIRRYLQTPEGMSPSLEVICWDCLEEIVALPLIKWFKDILKEA